MKKTHIEILSSLVLKEENRKEALRQYIERGYARPNNPSHWVGIDVGMKDDAMEDQGEIL